MANKHVIHAKITFIEIMTGNWMEGLEKEAVYARLLSQGVSQNKKS